MKQALKEMEAFDEKKKCANVIVETPKGSQVKYAFNLDTGIFELKRALPEGMMFPFNFGFIPGTKAEDGDPVDILILNQEGLLPGCLVKVRLLGVIEATQKEKGKKKVRNDRLVGVAIPKESPTYLEQIELNKKTLTEIEYFFRSYNKLAGKKFKVLGTGGAGKALQLVKKGQKKAKGSG